MVLPLDMPDDYIWQPGSGKSQLSDQGELAVRLGSIVSYDRRGSVYWFDGFENGFSAWQQIGYGTDSEIRYQTQQVNSGLLAAKLTGPSDGNYQAAIYKRVSPALLTTFGLETTFSLEDNPKYYFQFFRYFTGTQGHDFIALADHVNDRITVYDETGTQQIAIETPIDGDYPQLFNTLKFTVDMNTLHFGRIQFNHHSADISNILGQSYNDTTPARIEITTGVQSEEGANGICYIDNVIVTVGDP